MLNTVHKTKMKAIIGRGGKDDTCDHGLYVQKLESRSVPIESIYVLGGVKSGSKNEVCCSITCS